MILQLPVRCMDYCMYAKKIYDGMVTHKDFLKAIFYDLPDHILLLISKLLIQASPLRLFL